ncbi:MAG: PKD domain-containing protein [Crocinitomix sp.]|nr:PKD domain-containing protein [Crocinitomix sp.]
MNTSIIKHNLFILLLFMLFGINSQASTTNPQNQDLLGLDTTYIEPCTDVLFFTHNIDMAMTGAVVFHPYLSYPFADLHEGFEILRMEWDFGDGTKMFTKSLSNMGHIYESPETFEVCFTIWSTNGIECCQDSYCEKIVIEDVAPCDFLDNFSIGINYFDSTKFFALGWYAEGFHSEQTQHYWDFGDGRTASGQNTTHTYLVPGTYLVSLTTFYLSDDRKICCSYTSQDSITFGATGLAPLEQGGVQNLANQKLNKPLTIYPNPSDGEFTLTSNGDGPIQSIAIYNQMGGVVYTEENTDDSFSKKVNLSHLEGGIYFVLVNKEDEENQSYSRIVIK